MVKTKKYRVFKNKNNKIPGGQAKTIKYRVVKNKNNWIPGGQVKFNKIPGDKVTLINKYRVVKWN